MKAREIKALHEAVYSQYHLLLQYSNRAADAAMNITKAQEVQECTQRSRQPKAKGCKADSLHLQPRSEHNI